MPVFFSGEDPTPEQLRQRSYYKKRAGKKASTLEEILSLVALSSGGRLSGTSKQATARVYADHYQISIGDQKDARLGGPIKWDEITKRDRKLLLKMTWYPAGPERLAYWDHPLKALGRVVDDV